MTNRHPQKYSDSESETCSSSSGSSYQSEYIEKIIRRHKKSSSDSESSSDDSRRDRRSREKRRHHRRSHSSSSDSSRSSKSSCSSKSSNSSCSSTDSKCDFTDIYNYFKNRLLMDEHLMVAGSTVYANAVDTDSSMIPKSYSVPFNNNTLITSVAHLHPHSPFFVREDGVYIVFFVAINDDASQWTVFVNGVAQSFTTTGTNSGAGQVACRSMLTLKKDDAVLIRNYTSNGASVNTTSYAGGKLVGNDLTFTLFKIAPATLPHRMDDCQYQKQYHKFRRLYKKLLHHLLCDKELMMKGFNVHGSFYADDSHQYVANDDVEFDLTTNVAGLEMINGLNPSGSDASFIKVLEDGVYFVYFFIDTTTACQFTVAVNGVPIETTTQGTNAGSGQLSIRTLLPLKKDDILTIKNYISNTPTLTTQANAGGSQVAMNAELVMYKIAPYTKTMPTPVECEIPECYKKCYENFREFLLRNDKLQIIGLPVLLSTILSTYQQIPVNDAIDWNYNIVERDCFHLPGTAETTVFHEGIYEISSDIITDEPAQWTVFVNGVPDLTTTTGRDSGSARILLRQLVKLNKNDKVEVRNYEANAGTLNVARNPGGTEPGNGASFTLVRLSHDNCYEPIDCPPCPPSPPRPPTPPMPPKEEECKKEECKRKSSEKKRRSSHKKDRKRRSSSKKGSSCKKRRSSSKKERRHKKY